MKIKRIEPIAVAFPMKKPVYMAGVEIKQADNILIRIEADNGTVGWGEAAEAPTMTGETAEERGENVGGGSEHALDCLAGHGRRFGGLAPADGTVVRLDAD